MNWRNSALKILGLSETEILILESLLEYRNVQKIAKHKELSRTGINYVLKNLIKKGLVFKKRVGKRNFYIAVSENELLKILDQTNSEIRGENKKGVKVKISKQDEFVVHVGINEIVPAYERIAFENKNERIRAIQHHKSWLDILKKLSGEQLANFNRAIIKNHLILDGMLNESAYEDYRKEIKENPEKNKEVIKSLEGRMADYTVFPDNVFNFHSEIWIFNSTTLMINWNEEVAIEITNENMTSFLKDMFEFVKMSGKKIDHNKMLKEIIE
jgi:predicted transcriptional regulator